MVEFKPSGLENDLTVLLLVTIHFETSLKKLFVQGKSILTYQLFFAFIAREKGSEIINFAEK